MLDICDVLTRYFIDPIAHQRQLLSMFKDCWFKCTEIYENKSYDYFVTHVLIVTELSLADSCMTTHLLLLGNSQDTYLKLSWLPQSDVFYYDREGSTLSDDRVYVRLEYRV